MTNLYPDPGLADPADYSFINTPGMAFALPAIVFDNANTTDAVSTTGQLASDIVAAIAVNDVVNMSVFVAGYSGGSASARLHGGSFVDLGIAGDGWTTPVSITAGTNAPASLTIRGTSGSSFRITLDTSREAIRISF
jgi:hypothetical protein